MSAFFRAAAPVLAIAIALAAQPASAEPTIDTTDRFAWGENIGWVNFKSTITYPPRIDFATGRLSGYAWSENCGWIDLGRKGTHFVKKNTIDAGPDTDGDMLADAWELAQAANAGLGAGLTHLDKTTDSDGDEQDGNVTTVGSGGAGSESFYGAADMGGNVECHLLMMNYLHPHQPRPQSLQEPQDEKQNS